MITQIHDTLKIGNNPEIKSLICHETLYFSGKVTKIRSWRLNCERNFVITDQAIYNLKNFNCKRKIEIQKLKGLTISKVNNQLVIHGEGNEYDYLIDSPLKFILVETIEKVYESLTGKELLFSIQGGKNLKEFVTTKSEKGKNPNLSKINTNNLMSIREYIESEGNININSHPQTEILSEIFNQNNKYKDEQLSNFKIINIIGKGAASYIYLSLYQNEYVVLKVIDKLYIINNSLIPQIQLEKNILSSFNEDFFVQIKFFFMTETKIIFVMPFYQGGDLYQLQMKKKTFDESKVAFFLVQVANMIKFLHEKNIIYRDLKPENLLLNNDGYLKLCDFGLCKIIENESELSSSFCGSTEYISPEIISGKGYSFISDWWSFGILCYELLFGIPPFYDKSIDRIFFFFSSTELSFPSDINISNDTKDFLIKLLKKNPEERLGSKGYEQIIAHPFFNSVIVDKIITKKTNTPIPISISDSDLTMNFDNIYTNMNPQIIENIEPKDMAKIKENEKLFEELK